MLDRMRHDTLSAQWAGGVRDGYPAGVPCWIDTTQPDPQAAAEFYRGLLGWELEDMLPPNSPGQYFVARLHGRDVGAGFRIWQAREHRGAQLVNAPGSWNWSNLNTPDAEGAMRFYTAIVGWESSEVDFGAGASWMVRMPGYADFLEVRNH